MNYQQRIIAIIGIAVKSIRTMDKASFDVKLSEAKWSKKELLGHLIDSAYNNHQRFLRAGSKSNLIFEGYDQDEWVRLNNYQARTLDDVLATWITANQHLCLLLENLPIESLERTTAEHNFHVIGMNRPEAGSPSSLSYLIWDYIFHLEYHLAQIIPDYQSLNLPFKV